MRAYTEARPYARDITAKIASGALRLFSGVFDHNLTKKVRTL